MRLRGWVKLLGHEALETLAKGEGKTGICIVMELVVP